MHRTLLLLVFLLGMPAAQAGSDLRMLALGDSYTIGDGVKRKERWPSQLLNGLEEQGIWLSLKYVAHSGWATADLIAALPKSELRPPYALVTVLIGINDQHSQVPLDQFRARYGDILRRAVKLAGDNPARVLALSIPEDSTTPRAQQSVKAGGAGAVASFNAAIRDEALAQSATWIDLTPVLAGAGSDAKWLAKDGLHYSGRMYGLWATAIRPYALRALRGGKHSTENAVHEP